MSINPVLERNGVKVVQVLYQGDEVQKGEEYFGAWTEYQAFLAVEETWATSTGPGGSWESGSEFFGISYGQISASNPTGTGTATWTGMMVGRDTGSPQPDTHDRSAATFGHLIMGDARVTVDLANPAVDVAFTGVRDVTANASRADMTWSNIPLVSGQFSNPDGSVMAGSFLGPNHEEVGGVFDKDSIAGAFGAVRD